MGQSACSATDVQVNVVALTDLLPNFWLQALSTDNKNLRQCTPCRGDDFKLSVANTYKLLPIQAICSVQRALKIMTVIVSIPISIPTEPKWPGTRKWCPETHWYLKIYGKVMPLQARCDPEGGERYSSNLPWPRHYKAVSGHSTPRWHYTPGKDPVPISQKAGWAPGLLWTGGKFRHHPDSILDRQARKQSLYRLSYQAHKCKNIIQRNNISCWPLLRFQCNWNLR